MDELAAIYVLRDPRDGAVRYIGMTAARSTTARADRTDLRRGR